MRDDDDPDFMTFVTIDSETDTLPVGDARQLWAPEALAKKDAEVAGAEEWAKATGREAFERVVHRFGRPPTPRAEGR